MMALNHNSTEIEIHIIVEYLYHKKYGRFHLTGPITYFLRDIWIFLEIPGNGCTGKCRQGAMEHGCDFAPLAGNNTSTPENPAVS